MNSSLNIVMAKISQLFFCTLASLLTVPVYYMAVKNMTSPAMAKIRLRHNAETREISRRMKLNDMLDMGREALPYPSRRHSSQTTIFKVEVFPTWTTKNPHDANVTRRFYLYSAIVAIHRAPVTDRQQSSHTLGDRRKGTTVHFVAFQEGADFTSLRCCASLQDRHGIYRAGIARTDFQSKPLKGERSSGSRFLMGTVYRCHFPFTRHQLRGAHVTLSSATSCPTKEGAQYLPLQEPERKEGGVATCAKVAFGHHLDPYKLVEWFEVQRLLGVDTIQLFECNNSDVINLIFRHYQQLGLLSLLPYKLPGRPWNRGFLSGSQDWIRWGIDTVLPIWDCRLRLAGHDYVMDIDMDEIILPRHFTLLKPFFKEQFRRLENVGALFFRVQRFVTDWGPVAPEAPLLMLQYLNSTAPRDIAMKYVYRPPRVHQALTHQVVLYPGFTRYIVPSSEAVIFHYRKCKSIWKSSCESRRITDRTMLKLKDDLIPSVTQVLRKVGL